MQAVIEEKQKAARMEVLIGGVDVGGGASCPGLRGLFRTVALASEGPMRLFQC